jgi:hypothetical protein
MPILVSDDGQRYEITIGGKGNGIIITGGAKGNPLPAELKSPEFWAKMDAIRDIRNALLKRG